MRTHRWAILLGVSYPVGLALTLGVELPLVLAVAHAVECGTRRTTLVALAANLLTHPLLWFVVAPWADDRLGLTGVLLAEGGVVVVEAIVYAHGLRPRIGGWLAGWLALLANAASLAVGVLVL